MTVSDILSRFDSAETRHVLSLRKFLLEKLKDIKELPDNSANLIGYGYGTGYKDMICTILLSKKGVKLGFYKGSELPDPAKLLIGSGKVHKYVEIRSEKDITNPDLRNLLKDAMQAYQNRKQ